MATLSPVKQLTRLPNTVTAQELWEVTQREGGAIVEGHLDLDLVRRLNEEIDPWMEGRDPLHGLENDPGIVAFTGEHTKRLMNLPIRAPSFAEVALNERLLEWAKLSLPLSGDIQLSCGLAIDILPGQPTQMLHRDEIIYPFLAERFGDNQYMVNVMHALTEFDEENGATRVVPNTHLHPKRPMEEFDVERDSLPAIMQPGNTLFWVGTLVHGGGANTSKDRVRRGLATNFLVGWLKQEEAFHLEISNEEAKTLKPRLRELLGFAGYRAGGAFSYFYDMADPYRVLFGEERPTEAPAAGGDWLGN